MHARTTIRLACLLLATLSFCTGSARGGSGPQGDLEELREAVDDLTALILQMQQNHADQINALKQEIAQLRADQAEEAPEVEMDELAALRGLALEEAGGEEQPEKTATTSRARQIHHLPDFGKNFPL